MAIISTFFKTFSNPEYPNLLLIKSGSRGTHVIKHKQNELHKLNNYIQQLKSEAPPLIRMMNKIIWKRTESEFIYPIFVVKGEPYYLPSMELCSSKDIKAFPLRSIIPYDGSLNIFSHFQLFTDTESDLHKDKAVILAPQQKQIWNDIKEHVMPFKNNWEIYDPHQEYVLSPNFSANSWKKYLHQYELVVSNYGFIRSVQECNHDEFTFSVEKQESVATCKLCKCELSFSKEKSQWLYKQFGVPLSIGALKKFNKLISELDGSNNVFIKAVQYQTDIETLMNAYDVFSLLDNFKLLYKTFISSGSRNTSFKVESSFFKFKQFGFEHYHTYADTLEWISTLDIGSFHEHLVRTSLYMTILEDLRSNFVLHYTKLVDLIALLLQECNLTPESLLDAEVVCINKVPVSLTEDETASIFSLIHAFNGKYGRTTFASALCGKDTYDTHTRFGMTTRPEYGLLKKHAYPLVLAIIDELLSKQYFALTDISYPKVKLSSKGLAYFYRMYCSEIIYIQPKPLNMVLSEASSNISNFLVLLDCLVVSNEEQLFHVRRQLVEHGVKFYRHLLSFLEQNTHSISNYYNLIESCYETKYRPIFEFYLKTKKDQPFTQILSSVLEKKETNYVI